MYSILQGFFPSSVPLSKASTDHIDQTPTACAAVYVHSNASLIQNSSSFLISDICKE